MAYFETLSLHPSLLQNLKELGFDTPTPVQQEAIPIALSGDDVLASAQTGTGKTAAFLLPAIHKLCDPSFRGDVGPQVLILVPTRELAIQVAGEAKKFSQKIPKLRTVCIYGGAPYPVQKKDLAKKHEILVATPGRLIDHIKQGRVNLSHVKMLILDEADRMLDMGFADDVRFIAESTDPYRQTLLFSATIDKKVLPASQALQKNPKRVEIAAASRQIKSLDLAIYHTDSLDHKMKLLHHIIQTAPVKQCIIFTSTIRHCEELSSELAEGGVLCEPLHGDMNQRQRMHVIKKLRDAKVQFLVATDVAARGIDVPAISHVINFDLPFAAEDFVHRVGRTARAGASGSAISFVSAKEKHKVRDIEKLLDAKIKIEVVAGLEPAKAPAKTFKKKFPPAKKGSFFKQNKRR